MIGNSIKSDINPPWPPDFTPLFYFTRHLVRWSTPPFDPAPQGQQLLELDSFAKLAQSSKTFSLRG